MAQAAELFETYDAKGIREDLSDVIYNIAPTDTPFLSMIGRSSASNTLHEWQTDTLAAASGDNAALEGDDAVLEASTATSRLANTTQISDKTAIVSGTLEAVRKAGRTREMAYQMTKRSKELKRDIEARLTGKGKRHAGAGTNGGAGTARQTAGFETWISTNDLRGAGGADVAKTGGTPNSDAAITDGTQRALTEDLVKQALQNCWTQGGEPDCLMPGPFNKRVISTFTGNVQRTNETKDRRLVSAIDVYEHDFGDVMVIPNRFSRDRTLLVIDKNYWAVAYLRPFQSWELSKTGDSEKRQILAEYALEARNEASSAVVADLTTS